MTDPGQIRHYMARAGAVAVALVLIALVGRALTEQSRTRDTVERALQIDCELNQRTAAAPGLVRYPTPALVELAAAHRAAYERKRCAGVVDPETGQTFGPPPPRFTAVPTPSPGR